ncbi:MAG: hypothetical protein CMB24_00815 [Euryarchaeota archaeon]|nr:hypothetical protein [Euryarchaeota archaeon]|tara:strand:+ start:1491 stop:3566 length:2076 start_codon:yes stop_codon:yes gene_type:complete
MSDRCEVTGLSQENMRVFQYLHSHITGTLEIPEPSLEALSGFNKPLQNTISSHAIHNSEVKRKESLYNHLKKSIASKFEGSKLSVFGSAESGLSLKGGDFDLCLEISDANEKKILKKIGGMLRGQGMEEVKIITGAKVPIVKFIDPRSGLHVDISINNSLALHNTRLLSSYAKSDNRVKELAICVKHWALHRNVSDSVNGTLSSYAWSILVIDHLIEQGVVANLQSGDDRVVIELEDSEFDITINMENQPETKSDADIASLLLSFFTRLATMDWDNSIISIRNGGPIARDEKGWMNEDPSALDIVNSDKEHPPRMGEHHLAIEDPFDIDHDLSRVVRAEGELRIRNELLRAAVLFGNGSTWKEICETIEPERLKNLEPVDIFHDLRDKSTESVESMLEKTRGEMDALDRRIDALEVERQSNLRMARAMRGVIEETSDLRKEHKAIIVGLKGRNAEIDDIKKKRDKINSDVILPIHMIEDELSKVYSRLTEELDIHRVPSLKKEKEQFSWFMELQAMHGKAREASELHQKFIELVKLQKEEIKKLKIYETKHDDTTSKLLEQEPLLKDKNINSKEVGSYDRRVQNIQKALRQRRGEMHKLRREAGRLDAWLRKKSNPQGNRGRGKRKGGKGKKTQENSGPMTLGDISGLLSGMSDESSSKRTRKVSSKKAGMRKMGNLSAHRGSRGQFKKKD